MMVDLEDYDNGKNMEALKKDVTSSPLLSWDFHLNNMSKMSKLYKDITAIKKLTGKLVLDVDLENELKENDHSIVITDTDLNIEFASSNLFSMTGYLPSEVIGKTPKIFQGPKTDKEEASKIRAHVNNKEAFEVILVNYRKNKSIYNCRIKGFPIFDKKGNLVKYVAVEHAA